MPIVDVNAALGIAAESPEAGEVKRSLPRTCSGKPDPKGNAQIIHIGFDLISTKMGWMIAIARC